METMYTYSYHLTVLCGRGNIKVCRALIKGPSVIEISVKYTPCEKTASSHGTDASLNQHGTYA